MTLEKGLFGAIACRLSSNIVFLSAIYIFPAFFYLHDITVASRQGLINEGWNDADG